MLECLVHFKYNNFTDLISYHLKNIAYSELCGSIFYSVFKSSILRDINKSPFDTYKSRVKLDLEIANYEGTKEIY